VSIKDYYGLLELPPTASAEEIKHAFRHQIARYHPDKVQHLGQEFQAMAADRAAELTEAYRVLSDETRRGEYDRERQGQVSASTPAASASAAVAPSPATADPIPPPPEAEPTDQRRARFSQERASRDEFVRQALVGRFRRALNGIASDYENSEVRGFDLACNPRSKLFARTKGPRLLVRFVDTVNADSITDTWTQAATAVPNDEVCVFLVGSAMAAAGELATAIAEQRKKASRGAAKVALIPVDARDWDARIPTDAPPVAKTVLTRLRTGA
jgi:curved DNA-binding protein CbpA